MDDFRSMSYGDRKMQIQSYYGGARPTQYPSRDFRTYSDPYASSVPQTYMANNNNRDLNLKKGKDGGSSSSKMWNLNDPEFQRKKRVASYKMYTVEGKVKGSLRGSFRWLKDRYTQVVYGWW